MRRRGRSGLCRQRRSAPPAGGRIREHSDRHAGGISQHPGGGGQAQGTVLVEWPRRWSSTWLKRRSDKSSPDYARTDASPPTPPPPPPRGRGAPPAPPPP